MKEVAESQLAGYLRTMRRRGYTIIGLEQTDSSKRLGSHPLPHKCVLLLGKEREGIPVELLQVTQKIKTEDSSI